MNGYELSRKFWDWSFENPDKVKPIHSAIYFFAIEHCNRLGWKDKFGFPSQMVMEAIGVKNWRTYSKALNDLVDFGFINMIEISKNQYSSNIIAIVKNTKAHTKALDKALSKHSTKHSQSTVSIDKQYNNITINKGSRYFDEAKLVELSDIKKWVKDSRSPNLDCKWLFNKLQQFIESDWHDGNGNKIKSSWKGKLTGQFNYCPINKNEPKIGPSGKLMTKANWT